MTKEIRFTEQTTGGEIEIRFTKGKRVRVVITPTNEDEACCIWLDSGDLPRIAALFAAVDAHATEEYRS